LFEKKRLPSGAKGESMREGRLKRRHRLHGRGRQQKKPDATAASRNRISLSRRRRKKEWSSAQKARRRHNEKENYTLGGKQKQVFIERGEKMLSA